MVFKMLNLKYNDKNLKNARQLTTKILGESPIKN